MSNRIHFTLRIEGMTCEGCARHVTQALKGVPGVESAEVGDWREGTAAVVANAKVSEEALAESVAKAGYRAIVDAKRPLEGEHQVPRSEGADFDLMTIGGGSAAFAAAIKAADLGARVAIVEEGTIGGTCVNIVLAAYPNITLIRGRAQLTGGRGVRVNGQAYTPGKILVATGSRPWAPPITGLAEAGYLDSTEALSLPALPQTLIVIGGGTIGLELGQLFARFGVRVTLVETLPHIAAAEELEISEALAKYLTAERMTVLTGTRIGRVERSGDEYRVHLERDGAKQTFAAEQLLITTGRRANTQGFGLEEAGVTLGSKGEIPVDPHLRTENPDIFAAGDCIGDPMFVYVAAYAGQLAAENTLTGAGKVYDLSALPRVTFTDPQLASVGLTEAQARTQGLEIETAILPLEHVPRAQASRNTHGLIKLIRERGSERLLGAHVLAAEAGEVIQEATLAIRFKLTTKDIIGTYHPYLTMVEGLKLAALTFSKDVTQLSCCAT